MHTYGRCSPEWELCQESISITQVRSNFRAPEVQLTCFYLHWWPCNSHQTAHWHPTIRGHVAYLTPPPPPCSHSALLELNVSALSADASRNSSCCLWQPQVWFRFMPCQIARIPVSHSLRRSLKKGQLLLSWASLNFVVFVGARWFGCYDTRERLYENMTTPKCGGVHHV